MAEQYAQLVKRDVAVAIHIESAEGLDPAHGIIRTYASMLPMA